MPLSREANGRLRIAGSTWTDVGRVRAANEDAILFISPAGEDARAKLGCLALVADGMGGHLAGEVASALAAQTVAEVYFSLDLPAPQALKSAFEAADRVIRDDAAGRPERSGMGTTCTALALRDGKLWLAHVGDSRAYILRDRELKQLSDDQTLYAQMLRSGVLTAAEKKARPGQNILLQALGAGTRLSPTIWSEGLPLRAGDILVLCSDGLWNMIADEAIATIASSKAPADACRELGETALAAGGEDNVSVGVFLVHDGGGNEAFP